MPDARRYMQKFYTQAHSNLQFQYDGKNEYKN